MIIMKQKILDAVKNRYPDAKLTTCYEAIANGNGKVEVHGFVVDDKYFIESKTLQVYDKEQFFLIEKIEEFLLD